jgi:hypothetical protein
MFENCPALQDPNLEEELLSPMDFVIQAAEAMVRSKIKSTMITKTGKRDAFGILLYNTRCRRPVDEEDQIRDPQESDEEDGHLLVGSVGTRATTVHKWIPLEPPGVSTVKALRVVQDDPIVGREKSLEKLYKVTKADDPDECDHGWSENPLRTALSEAKEVFQSSKHVNRKTKQQIPDTKQIWIFTTNDDPCQGNEQLINVVKTLIADAQEDDIQVCIWPLPYGDVNGHPQKTVQQFDYKKFYDVVGAFATLKKDDDDSPQPDEEFNLAAVIEDMQYRWKKTNKSFAVPLLLPNWKTNRDYPGIWLDVFKLVQVGRRPLRVHVHQQTGR